jgi:hypothetical protein
MRVMIFGLIACLSACVTPRAHELSAIEVVYHPERMYYTIENGGHARMVPGAGGRVFEFEASRGDFQRVAALLAPLEAEGLTCASPSPHSAPGHIIFRRGEAERRVVMHTACTSDGARPLARNADEAYRLMEEMARARYVAPTIPEPEIITVEHRYWGNLRSSWSVSRTGEGSYTAGDQVTRFAVSTESFAEIRAIFQPYESRWFECNRVIADGPYGDIIWSSGEGREDQRTRFDAGCVTGDAADLFARLDQAEALVNRLRAAPE